MLASDLMLEVSEDLLDQDTGDTYVRWTQATLLKYLNAGERQLVYFKPTAYAVTRVFQLSEGVYQSLPDGSNTYQDPSANTLERAVELIKITRNMGADGLTAGETIYPVDSKDMEETYPGWRSATASATVQHYIYDEQDRTKFSVYPPQPASSGWIEAVYSAVPNAIVPSGTSYDVAFNLGDEYAEVLKEYMKFRAYAVDAANSQFAASRAVAHWNLFLTMVGRKDLIEAKYRGTYDDRNKPVS